MKKGLILGLLAAGAGVRRRRVPGPQQQTGPDDQLVHGGGQLQRRVQSRGRGRRRDSRSRDQIGSRSGADEHRGRERRRVDPGGDQGGAEGNHRPRDAGHVSRDRVHR